MTTVLALDVGSSSVRAQRYDERGDPVDELRRVRSATRDPEGLVGVVREVVAGRDADVDAVGVSCFGQSLLPLDAQGRPLAKLYGWLHFHDYDSRHSVPGYPDLTLVRGERLIYAELKTERGRLTEAQRDWLERLGRTCAETYVWRPSDLPVIAAILRRRT